MDPNSYCEFVSVDHSGFLQPLSWFCFIMLTVEGCNCGIVNRLETNLYGRENNGQLYIIHSLVQWLLITLKFATR